MPFHPRAQLPWASVVRGSHVRTRAVVTNIQIAKCMSQPGLKQHGPSTLNAKADRALTLTIALTPVGRGGVADYLRLPSRSNELLGIVREQRLALLIHAPRNP